MLNELKSSLSIPFAYHAFWVLVGGPTYMKKVVSDHVRPQDGYRILDIGCGPGTALPYLRGYDYTGVDLSAEYIDRARKRFPNATFFCSSVNDFQVPRNQSFDRALALGVVHHLDDDEARRLFQTARDALKPGGKLVTVDGVFEKPQSRVARFFLNRDRGQFIRQESDYLRIARQVFESVRVRIRHDLINIPYSHIVMECE
jgi:cyclopropane fatty-acyl-phospholipid synthase-like methyltransferase